MAAALLAPNIQALVRNIAHAESNPLVFASQISQHLCHHTPDDRFATAVFLVLNRATGELTYVNAGHNAPMVLSSASTILLEATGKPLGLFARGEYEVRKSVIPDGVRSSCSPTDWPIRSPARVQKPVCVTLSGDDSRKTMSNLKSLVDPKFNHDDVTILLVTRAAA